MPNRCNRHRCTGSPERRQQSRCPVGKRAVEGKPKDCRQRKPGQAELRPYRAEQDQKDTIHNPFEVTRQSHAGIREHWDYESSQQSHKEQKDSKLKESVTKYWI